MRRVHNNSTVRVDDGSKRGAIVIELALILSLLVALFAIIIDLGLLLREHQVVQNGAREGARFSSLPQNCISCRPVLCSDCLGGCNDPNCKTQADVETEIKQRVIDYLAQEGITISAGDVTVNQAEPITIGTITATGSEIIVSYTRSPLLATTSVTITGRSVFRNLGNH